MVHLLQCCVTSPPRAEPMRGIAKLDIVEGIQDHSDDFREQLIRPHGQAEWALFPVPLWNVGSSCWFPLIPLEAESFDDRIKFCEGRPICCFLGNARRECACVPVD